MLTDHLQTAVQWLVYVIIVILLSMFCALCAPILRRVAAGYETSLLKLRGHLLAGMTNLCWVPFRKVWDRQSHMFAQPEIVQLQLLHANLHRAAALPGAAVADLQKMTKGAAEESEVLTAVMTHGGAVEPTAKADISAAGAVMKTILALGIALAIAITNFWMLQLFFNELLGDIYLMWEPFPLKVGHIIGAVFGLTEIGVGFALGAFEDRSDSGVARIMAMFPWVVLVGLGVVEAVAYADLSHKLGLPSQLGIHPMHGMYAFVDNCLALLGIGLTLGLASLGHLAYTSWNTFNESRHIRRREQRFAKLISDAKGATGRIEHLKLEVKQVTESLQSLGSELPKMIEDGFGQESHAVTMYEAIRGRIEQLKIGSTSDVDGISREARAIISTVLAVLFGLLCYLAFRQIQAYCALQNFDQAWSLALSAGFPGIVVLMGYGLRHSGMADLHPTRRSPLPRRFDAIFYAAVLLVMAVVIGHFAQTVGTAGPSFLPNLLVALLLVAGLAYSAGDLDRIGSAVLVFLGLVSSVACAIPVTLVWSLCLFVESLLAVAKALVEFAGVPGTAIMQRLSPR